MIPVFRLLRGGPRFLGDEAVVGVGLAHDLDDRLFGRAVHLGNEVVGAFGLDHERVAAQRRAVDDRAGAARGAHGDVQHGMH